jgi:hypothetical protein
MPIAALDSKGAVFDIQKQIQAKNQAAIITASARNRHQRKRLKGTGNHRYEVTVGNKPRNEGSWVAI